MQKKLIVVLAIAIILIAALVGAWQLNLFGSAGPTIKIGLVEGSETADGKDMDRAARLAVEEINAAGGIYVAELNAKLKIQLVIADTVDDTADKAKGPVNRAITEDKVDLLIGGAKTAGTLADQMYAINNRVPYIITGASLNLVTRRGPQGNYGGLPVGDPKRVEDAEGMSYMFHYCTTTYDYSKTVVRFLAENMKPSLDSTYSFPTSRNLRLAVIYRNDPYGQGVLADTKKIIADENLPITVVAERAYSTTATSYPSDLTAIKESKPDAVYAVGFAEDTSEIIKEGINDAKLNSVYIAVEICEDPAFYNLLGKTGDKQLLESKFGPFVTPAYSQTVQNYVDRYQQKYSTVPGMIGADTYDAFYLVKDAIERAGSLNKTLVRDAIETTSMNQMLIMTTTGKVQFSTGTNYHEISPVTFIEQLIWDEAAGQCKPKLIYPNSVPGISTFKQVDFTFPKDYQPGTQG